MLQGARVRNGGHDPEIHLHAAAPDRDFGVSFGDHPVCRRVGRRAGPGLGVRKTGQRRPHRHRVSSLPGHAQQIRVLEDALAPPQAPGQLDPLEQPTALDRGHELLGNPAGFMITVQVLVLLPEGDGPQDLLLALVAEALEGQQMVLPAGVLQLADARDPQALPQQAHPFRPQAAEGQQLLEPGGKRSRKLLQNGRAAGAGQLAQHLGDSLADPLDPLEALFQGELLEAFGMALDDPGSPVEGQGFEGVLARQLLVHGDPVQDRRDLFVVHVPPWGPAARGGPA